MNTPSTSNISTTPNNTITMTYITPPTSAIDTLQSHSITNTPMKFYLIIILELIEIEFAKLLIQMSPAIARLDNFDDHNLGNNLKKTIEYITTITVTNKRHVSIK